MAVRTASDVAELETEVVLLRSNNEALERRVAVLEAENGGLKIENARLDQRARDELRKATEMETIINQTSMGLVSALQRYNRDRKIAQEMRRARQEKELAAETGPAPAFLQQHEVDSGIVDGEDQAHGQTFHRTPENSRLVVEAGGGRENNSFAPAGGDAFQPEERRELDPAQDREDRVRLREAAERIARPMAPAMRPGRVDTTIADRDPRLPEMGEYRSTPIPTAARRDVLIDQENLARLGGSMRSTR